MTIGPDSCVRRRQRGAAPAVRIAWLSCVLAWPVAAVGATDAELAASVNQLLDRVRQLEERNRVLEMRVQQLGSASGPVVATTAAAAPAPPSGIATASPAPLAADGGASMMPPTPSVEFGMIATGQRANEAAGGNGRINYRGDLLASVPAGSVGSAEGTLVGQLRFGQGSGVAVRPTHTGAVNSTTFEAATGSDQTYAIVAQAYYQLAWALRRGAGSAPAVADHVELTLGKLDLFGFFDQNAAAADEGSQFLNNVFVHNPLLDSGGDIAADGYGFQPGVRLAWSGRRAAADWGASLGIFAAGAAADFNASPGRPLVIGQLEWAPRRGDDEPHGNYRLYAWTNGRTNDLAGDRQRHAGVGVSVDQRVSPATVLFGRWGKRTRGDGRFDRALTIGVEHAGSAWGRADDAFGAAIGWLPTGAAWRRATAADPALVGHAASGSERVAELYYRIRLNRHLDVSPDFQLIERAGGSARAPTLRLFGVRASLGF